MEFSVRLTALDSLEGARVTLVESAFRKNQLDYKENQFT